MKDLFLKIKIFAEFIISIGIFYFIFSYHIPLSFPIIVLLFVAVFVLFQALGNVDKLNGYGNNPDNSTDHHHHYNEFNEFSNDSNTDHSQQDDQDEYIDKSELTDTDDNY